MTAQSLSADPDASRYQVVGYFPEWGGPGRPYRVKDIVTSGSAERLTLLNYAFAVPRPDGGTVTCQIADPGAAYGEAYPAADSIDGVADEPDQPLRGHFNQLRKLKAAYPNLRILISIGGWTDSTWFSDAARTADARRAFVASCIDSFIRGDLPVIGSAGGAGAAAGIFDGFDIDWEFPVSGGYEGIHNDPNDGPNLAALMAEFRTRLEPISPPALLTMAVPASRANAEGYGIPDLVDSVDLFNLMAYDLHGSWDTATGHHTNLCSTPREPDSSAVATVRMYRDDYGVPPAKLVLGTAFYGNGWIGVGRANDGLAQAASGPAGADGSGTRNYDDLAPLFAEGYSRHWDAVAKAPWLYSPTARTFWSYDDTESLALKMQFVRWANLAGAMFWELSGDDASGSLVRAIHGALVSPTASGDPCSQ